MLAISSSLIGPHEGAFIDALFGASSHQHCANGIYGFVLRTEYSKVNRNSFPTGDGNCKLCRLNILIFSPKFHWSLCLRFQLKIGDDILSKSQHAINLTNDDKIIKVHLVSLPTCTEMVSLSRKLTIFCPLIYIIKICSLEKNWCLLLEDNSVDAFSNYFFFGLPYVM